MIFSFSGTGNSNYIAQCMADALGNPLLCMNDRIKLGDHGTDMCQSHAVTYH